MSNKIFKTALYITIGQVIFLSSCKKYLEERPDKKLVVASSLTDLQGLLDYYSWVNKGFGSGEAAADNYYISSSDYANLAEDQKNIYTWNPDRVFLNNFSSNAWSYSYDNVYRANTVLYYLDKIDRESNDQSAWNNVKGQALFLRAKSFLYVASVWSLAYDEATASSDLGIPLRLDPDFNKPSVRSSVQQTYDRITTDLKESISLLPAMQVSVTRSTLPAAYALLARTYLYMRKYDSCYKYAGLCLSLKDGLIDFNTLNPASSFPFSAIPFASNPEVIYYSVLARPALLAQSRAKIDSFLYQSYSNDDLRRSVFFKNNGNGSFSHKGSYLGSLSFDGLTTSDAYLMRAESAARLNNLPEALERLNTLLKKRWKNTAVFVPVSVATPQEALDIILKERRKELIMTDTRWMDIKRLNKEGAGITLKRIINNQQYVLLPGDLRYAMAIPEDIISITGIPQNPR